MQILVLVANTQMKTLRAEGEKGSMITVLVHGLVDPKALGNSKKAPKGNLVNIPGPVASSGNTWQSETLW